MAMNARIMDRPLVVEEKAAEFLNPKRRKVMLSAPSDNGRMVTIDCELRVKQ